MDKKVSNIKERVLCVADYKAISKDKFIEDLGMTYGNFKGKQKTTSLNSDFLDKILSKYPDVNPDWLISGSGEMIKGKDPASANEIQIIKQIPFYDVDFYSGFTQIFNDQTITPSYYFYLPEFVKAEFAIKNSGKSMAKELGCDDILGLREVKEWQDYFPQGEIYAVVTSNDLRTIKKVRKNPENTKLVLIPKPLDADKFDYPEYEEVPINMVLSLFQVVASTHSKKLAL